MSVPFCISDDPRRQGIKVNCRTDAYIYSIQDNMIDFVVYMYGTLWNMVCPMSISVIFHLSESVSAR